MGAGRGLVVYLGRHCGDHHYGRGIRRVIEWAYMTDLGQILLNGPGVL